MFTPSQMNVVARYLAALPDAGILLNLNKCPDFGLVPDLAPVEIDELRQPYVFAELYICRRWN